MLGEPAFTPQSGERTLEIIREVMDSAHRTFIYHLPLPGREPVYVRYPLEDSEGDALLAAHRRYRQIMERPHNPLPAEVREIIRREVPGVLERAFAGPCAPVAHET